VVTVKNGVFWNTPCGSCKNVSEEVSASFVRVTTVGELGTTLAVTSNRRTQLRVFDNRALRRIFGPKRDEVTECCTKLYSEELQTLSFSPCIIGMIKSRSILSAGHVARMG
jgi:uncharacterized protein (UPF0218 family)